MQSADYQPKNLKTKTCSQSLQFLWGMKHIQLVLYHELILQILLPKEFIRLNCQDKMFSVFTIISQKQGKV